MEEEIEEEKVDQHQKVIDLRDEKPEEEEQQDNQDEEDEDKNDDEDEEEDDGQQPLLFVDINLGGDEQERIVVYEGDTAKNLA